MNNQECKVRPKILIVYSDEPVFFPFSIKTSKVNSAVVVIISMIHMQNLVFNLMSRANETKHIEGRET